MKITIVLVREIEPVNFLNAWDINLACKPTWVSPISPSISALGVNAATESTTRTDIEPDLINVSVISKACSPVSGWEISNSSVFTPNFFAYTGSKACSASTKPQIPPAFCASATTCNANVVFPEDSGP